MPAPILNHRIVSLLPVLSAVMIAFIALDRLFTHANTAHMDSATLPDFHNDILREPAYIIYAVNIRTVITGAVDMQKCRHNAPPASERHMNSGSIQPRSLNNDVRRHVLTGKYASMIPGIITVISRVGLSVSSIIYSHPSFSFISIIFSLFMLCARKSCVYFQADIP